MKNILQRIESYLSYFLSKLIVFIFIGLLVASFFNVFSSNIPDYEDVEEYAEEYNDYDSFEYALNSEYYQEDDEQTFNALQKAYEDGFKKGVEDTIDYIQNND